MVRLRLLVSIFTLIIAFDFQTAQAKTLPYQLNCDYGKGNPLTQHILDFTVQIVPQNGMCHVFVSNKQGESVFKYDATGIQVSSSIDLIREGQQFVLIQIDTDPYKLFVISFGSHPGVVATVENKYGFWIQNGCADGRWHIWTADGAFQGAQELIDVYHYDLIVPEVVLDLRGGKLVDSTPECKQYFDGRIAAARAELTKRQIETFRDGSIKDTFLSGEVKGKILGIVFKYLYTARDSEAKDFLEEMWPKKDVDRVWQWMTKKRSEGLLAHLEKAKM
jgi:hypothetical protein